MILNRKDVLKTCTRILINHSIFSAPEPSKREKRDLDFQWPRDCAEYRSCEDYKITWKILNSNLVAFNITAKQPKSRWVGVGFSSSQNMVLGIISI